MGYQCDIDIRDLIDLFDVMRSQDPNSNREDSLVEDDDDEQLPGLGLGPNGAMIYCMQFLQQNIEWLLGKIREKKCRYFVIDMPG